MRVVNLFLSSVAFVSTVSFSANLDPRSVPEARGEFFNRYVCHGERAEDQSGASRGSWSFEVYYNYNEISRTDNSRTYEGITAGVIQINDANRPVLNWGAQVTVGDDHKNILSVYYNTHNVDALPDRESEPFYQGYEMTLDATHRGVLRKWFEYISSETGKKARYEERYTVRCLKM